MGRRTLRDQRTLTLDQIGTQFQNQIVFGQALRGGQRMQQFRRQGTRTGAKFQQIAAAKAHQHLPALLGDAASE